MNNKIIKALKNADGLKGVICTKCLSDELGINAKYFDDRMVLYVLINMLEEGTVELNFKDKECKDYKYLQKLLKHDK